MGIEDIFIFLLVIEHYINSKQILYRGGDFLAVIKYWVGVFSLLFLFSHFRFLSLIWMTTQRMVG